jgi:hypothetical protein
MITAVASLSLFCLLLVAAVVDSHREMRKQSERHLDYVRKMERERLALIREKLELQVANSARRSWQ